MARVLGADNVRQAGALFIDVGGGTTDVALVRQGGIEGTRMFALGGRAFTKSIADRLDLPFPRAESLKVDYARGLPVDRRDEVAEIVRDDVAVWSAGVELVMEELAAGEMLPSRIHVCGGGSRLPEISEAIAAERFWKRLPFARPPEVAIMAPDQVERDRGRDRAPRRPAGRDADGPGVPGDRAPDVRGSARRHAPARPPRHEGVTGRALGEARPVTSAAAAAWRPSSTSTPRTRSPPPPHGSGRPRTRAWAWSLPFGSRVATSRINFRLLAREAMSHGRRLDIVAPDASGRALAASAGLPVFASVGEYEEALDAEDDEKDARRAASRAAAGLGGAAGVGGAAIAGDAAEPPGRDRRMPRRPDRGLGGRPRGEARHDAARTGDASAAARAGVAASTAAATAGAAGDLSETDLYDAPGAVGASNAEDRRAAAGGPRAASRATARRDRGRLVVVAVIVGAFAIGAYLLLPSASITVVPKPRGDRPRDLQRPGGSHHDLGRRRGRGRSRGHPDGPRRDRGDLPGDRQASRADARQGGGALDQLRPDAAVHRPLGNGGPDYGRDRVLDRRAAVPAGGRLSGGGASPSIDCQSSEVSVTAVQPGPDGNVEAGRSGSSRPRTTATSCGSTTPNPRPVARARSSPASRRRTSMGRWPSSRTSSRTQFASEVEHPSGVPEGTTPFPATAVLGDPTPTTDPASLVGQEVDSFTLGLAADGTVLAADASPAEAIAEQRLRASVAEGREIVPDSASVEVGEGTVVNGVIEFPVTATATQVRPLDAAALERSVLGCRSSRRARSSSHTARCASSPGPTGSPRSRHSSSGSSSASASLRTSRYHPPDEPHPGSRPRRAADRARRGRLGDRRRPPAGDIARGKTIEADADALARVCREQDVVELVIGLPVEASGVEGSMAEGARAWATEIGARLDLPVSLRDERLSSFEAERRAGPDAAGPFGWGAVTRPAQRVPGQDRPRGRGRDPAGRARRPPLGGAVSIRSGQGPRDPDQSRGPGPGPSRDPYQRTGRYGRGPGDQRRYERYGDRRGGVSGVVRFLLFLFVLAAVVLVVMATVARPLLRAVGRAAGPRTTPRSWRSASCPTSSARTWARR